MAARPTDPNDKSTYKDDNGKVWFWQEGGSEDPSSGLWREASQYYGGSSNPITQAYNAVSDLAKNPYVQGAVAGVPAINAAAVPAASEQMNMMGRNPTSFMLGGTTGAAIGQGLRQYNPNNVYTRNFDEPARKYFESGLNYGEAAARRYDQGVQKEQAEAQAETERAKTADIRTQMQKEADYFKSKMPEYEQMQKGILQDSLRRKLASQLQIKGSQLASRGLIGGGASRAAKAMLQNEMAANYADQSSNITNNLQNQYDTFSNLVTNAGLNQYGLESSAYQQQLQNEFENMQRMNQAYGALGSAGGSALGTYLAKRQAANG